MSRSQRLAMWVWYRGEPFVGFQRQSHGLTVQQALLQALAPEGVRALVASGRTDRGVHARMQVVSVRAPAQRELPPMVAAVRTRLPPGMGVCALVHAPEGFHAQFSGDAKEYRYRVLLGSGDAHPWAAVAWRPSTHPRIGGAPVDVARLAELLRAYEGTHDFIAFHEKSSARKPRTVHGATLHEREPGLFEIRFTASGFGRYQVRYMVGSAVGVAAGALEEAAWREALATGRAVEGIKAPAAGLVLWAVHYPERLAPFDAALLAAPPTLPGEPPFC